MLIKLDRTTTACDKIPFSDINRSHTIGLYSGVPAVWWFLFLWLHVSLAACFTAVWYANSGGC